MCESMRPLGARVAICGIDLRSDERWLHIWSLIESSEGGKNCCPHATRSHITRRAAECNCGLMRPNPPPVGGRVRIDNAGP